MIRTLQMMQFPPKGKPVEIIKHEPITGDASIRKDEDVTVDGGQVITSPPTETLEHRDIFAHKPGREMHDAFYEDPDEEGMFYEPYKETRGPEDL